MIIWTKKITLPFHSRPTAVYSSYPISLAPDSSSGFASYLSAKSIFSSLSAAFLSRTIFLASSSIFSITLFFFVFDLFRVLLCTDAFFVNSTSSSTGSSSFVFWHRSLQQILMLLFEELLAHRRQQVPVKMIKRRMIIMTTMVSEISLENSWIRSISS